MNEITERRHVTSVCGSAPGSASLEYRTSKTKTQGMLFCAFTLCTFARPAVWVGEPRARQQTAQERGPRHDAAPPEPSGHARSIPRPRLGGRITGRRRGGRNDARCRRPWAPRLLARPQRRRRRTLRHSRPLRRRDHRRRARARTDRAVGHRLVSTSISCAGWSSPPVIVPSRAWTSAGRAAGWGSRWSRCSGTRSLRR